MNLFLAVVRRECRVAFSRHAQPVWFRLLKWVCILTGMALFRDRRWFWWTLVGAAAAGLSVHFIYRRNTKNWTRAWGRWKDFEAGRD